MHQQSAKAMEAIKATNGRIVALSLNMDRRDMMSLLVWGCAHNLSCVETEGGWRGLFPPVKHWRENQGIIKQSPPLTWLRTSMNTAD